MLVQDLCNAGGAGCAIGLHLTYTSPRYMIQSHPAAWRDLYARKGYLMMDPTVHWGLESQGWTRWSDLVANDADGILAEAAGYGLVYGVTVATVSRGSRSIASFARGDREYTDGEALAIEAQMAELHDLTLHVHALPPTLHELLRQLSIILTQH